MIDADSGCEYCHSQEDLQWYFGTILCSDCIDMERNTDWDEFEQKKRERIAEENEYQEKTMNTQEIAKQILTLDPVILDTESTGFENDDQIIEIAAITTQGQTAHKKPPANTGPGLWGRPVRF